MYENATKADARNWSWNRICERWPARYQKRGIRVAVLIGDTTAELDTGIRKGFDADNIIGIDKREDACIQWRWRGGTAYHGSLDEYLASGNPKPDAAILDFCSGFTIQNVETAVRWWVKTDVLIVNMLRGRDDVRKIESPLPLDNKNRNDRLLVTFTELIHRVMPEFDPVDIAEVMKPDFFSYKSKDSGQYFDLLKVERPREVHRTGFGNNRTRSKDRKHHRVRRRA